MPNWTQQDLEEWDGKLSEKAREYGLDWFDIEYEIVDYRDMIGHMAYTGMPSHYHHWSYGKSFERIHHY